MSDGRDPSEGASLTTEGERDARDDHRDDTSEHDADKAEQPPRKRQRVRLSCLECRRRKLSCDRGLPCERCIRSGTPDRCSYETRPGLSRTIPGGLSQVMGFDGRLSVPNGGSDYSLARKAPGEYDRVRRLELEVAQLKNLLSKQVSLDGSTVLADSSPSDHKLDPRDEPLAQPLPNFAQYPEAPVHKDELRFFRGKEFKTRYFGPHNAQLAFSELTGLCPFMKETAEEWLRPLHIHNKKDRGKRKAERERFFSEPDPQLEALLPSKAETDDLVEVYLEQFEQIHRVVHIPSFRKRYATFWDPTEARSASFTALVLSMISISSCVRGNTSGRFVGLVSNSHHQAQKWILACDEWHARQSQKHRRLIHYQIACLIYLAKRVNTVKKKRFWKGAGALVQDGISVGLHREPSHMNDKISIYNQEMRRRLWATMQEFDLQASVDFGLPTLLGTLHYDVNPPRNLDDDEFDEDSTQLPASKPLSVYTYSSYQQLSRQSLALRLELSRVLTGPPGDIDYDQVLRYTNDITAEIDSLPSWDIAGGDTADESARKPLLAYTLLHVQLRQYIIPLHQPYLRLRKNNSKYQYSEIMYYNAARDMVLLHDKLAEQNIKTLNFLREDALTLAINLCNVTMLQPRGSTNMIMVNSHHTLKLLEKCLALKEDRILRCGNNEPWGYSIMCCAVGLIEAHLGTKTGESAKATSAERFINLHYKMLACQEPPLSSQQLPLSSQQSDLSKMAAPPATPAPPPPPDMRERAKSITPFHFTASQASSTQVASNPVDAPPTPWWLSNTDPSVPAANPDFSLELLGLNLNEIWGESWDFS